MEVTTSAGTSAKRTRRGKPPENVDPATGEIKDPAPAEPPAAAPAPRDGDPEPLTEHQTAGLRVLVEQPGADLEQFRAALNGVNGSTFDETEAKAVVDLLIRRGLATLTEHNDYEATPAGEAAIVT